MNERQSDFEWLQQFARAGNQSAFRELVRRHIDLVFATALRKVGDAGGAEEISQNVFGALARKAWRFAPDDSLPAWLHKTTLLESQAWLRGEMRRRRREQTAAELGTTMKTPDEQPAFQALVPLLDEALLSLREKDREALLLRYYESQSLRDVGAALGVSDDTAQKRVTTALEKLSQFFQRRGFKTATVAATTAALQHTASSASAATVSLVFNAALQAAPPALVGLSAFFARFASLTKVQTAAVCVAIAAGPVAWQISEQREANAALIQAKTQLAATQNEFSVVQTEIQRLNESTTQLDESLAATLAAAARSAETAQKFEAWKQRTREQLLAADYQWPEDSLFVRIPKRMAPQLQVHQPISQPGVIKQEARELLGLTPGEREQAETALHDHITALDRLIESNLYETNRLQYSTQPANTLAIKVFGVPALGAEVKQRGDELKSALKTVLGDERWPLLTRALLGSSELRRTLSLDAGERGQEMAVWIKESEGNLMLGFAVTEQNHWSGQDGLALKVFLPGFEFPDGMTGSGYLGLERFPASLAQPVLAWIQHQAETRLEKKGAQ